VAAIKRGSHDCGMTGVHGCHSSENIIGKNLHTTISIIKQFPNKKALEVLSNKKFYLQKSYSLKRKLMEQGQLNQSYVLDEKRSWWVSHTILCA
jgi:hypothetical protein